MYILFKRHLSYFSVRIVSPKKTTHVGDQTALSGLCDRCVMARTPCVKVKMKKEGAFTCTLCREKKKKCVSHKAKPPPADVKKGDNTLLPNHPLKKAPSVHTTGQTPNRRPKGDSALLSKHLLKNAPFVPAMSQKSNRRPFHNLSRDSTAPLPQWVLKTAPTVPAKSQKPNCRPTHDLSRYSTPAQSDEGPIVVVKPNLLHVLSPPDPPPSKKRRMAKAPELGSPFNETYVQVPSIPASHS